MRCRFILHDNLSYSDLRHHPHNSHSFAFFLNCSLQIRLFPGNGELLTQTKGRRRGANAVIWAWREKSRILTQDGKPPKTTQKCDDPKFAKTILPWDSVTSWLTISYTIIPVCMVGHPRSPHITTVFFNFWKRRCQPKVRLRVWWPVLQNATANPAIIVHYEVLLTTVADIFVHTKHSKTSQPLYCWGKFKKVQTSEKEPMPSGSDFLKSRSIW